MPAASSSPADPPAFKEWQLICDALERGEQSLLLRKGGIAEGRQGFRWQHDRFLLFPTRFHQQVEGVRGNPPLPEPPGDARLELRLWATIESRCRLTEAAQLDTLREFHQWTDAVVAERFHWGDEPGLEVALIRTHRLREPWLLEHADRHAFGGCRSWLTLPADEWSGGGTLSAAIAEAEPVIADDAFERRFGGLRRLITAGRP